MQFDRVKRREFITLGGRGGGVAARGARAAVCKAASKAGMGGFCRVHRQTDKSQRGSKKARAFLAGLPTYANGSVERLLGGLSR
jgi:hypothetical protein